MFFFSIGAGGVVVGVGVGVEATFVSATSIGFYILCFACEYREYLIEPRLDLQPHNFLICSEGFVSHLDEHFK